jgi:uncharacterized protein with NRDE domain
MCFVLLLYGVHRECPIVIAANREERRDRPATGPHDWNTVPRIWAGRDEVAGGTWLGVNEAGLVVAITNRRAEANDPNAPSRGALCLGALHQPTAAATRDYLNSELAQRQFNPFNLIAVDGQEAWAATWRGEVTPLGAGIHVIVSQGDADDPALPRVRRGRRLARRLEPARLDLPTLLSGLAQICANRTRPDPICRPGGARGTVSSSLIAVDQRGQLAAYWHAPGPPSEYQYSRAQLDISAPAMVAGPRRA